MIREITGDRQEEMIRFLQKDGPLALFFMADLENFGIKSNRHFFLGQYCRGELASVVLGFYRSRTLSLSGLSDPDELCPVLQQGDSLAGERSVVEVFKAILEPESFREQYFVHLKKLCGDYSVIPDINVNMAAPEDCEELFAFQKEIKEFDLNGGDKEAYCDALMTGTGRIAFIRKEGKIIASASSVAEYGSGAMITAVATHSFYRGKGYATACMKALCRVLLKEGKQPSLFFDNPRAGHIYQSLGFKQAGFWGMGTIRKGK